MGAVGQIQNSGVTGKTQNSGVTGKTQNASVTGKTQNAGVTIAGGITDNAMGILSTVSGGQNSDGTKKFELSIAPWGFYRKLVATRIPTAPKKI